MTARKVHCISNLHRMPGLSACGNRAYPPLSVAQFVWLPASVQCGRCLQTNIDLRLEATFGRPVSATPEMLIAVESIVVSIERLDQAAQLVPHNERGCYHEQCVGSNGSAPRIRCWCGRWSMLDFDVWCGTALTNDPVQTIRRELFERKLDREVGHANPSDRAGYIYEGPNGTPRPQRDVSPSRRLKTSLGDLAAKRGEWVP